MNVLKKNITVVLALLLVANSFAINVQTVFAEDEKFVAKKTDECKDKHVLSKEEVPSVMDYNEAVKNKHVKRQKDKEKGLDEVVFQNEDGSYTMYVYDQNVKYVDSNGIIKDIDVGIEKITTKSVKKGYTYSNGNNIVNVDFPDKISDGIITENDGHSIKMYPADNKLGEIKVDGNKAIYEDAYGEGTKLIYTPTLNGVKEEIVLEKYNYKEKYTFVYDIGDGYINTLDDDCLYIYSSDGENIGLIEPIYMIDANNKFDANSDMNYYENSDGTWTVEVIPNKEFLLDDDTEYPVIIDPTYTYNVNRNNSSTGIEDVTINSTSTSAGSSGSLFVGNRSNTENGISRVLMRIPSVTSSICSSIEVQSATVTLRDIMCESNAMVIECRQFTGSPGWSENTASMSGFVNNSYVGEIYDTQTVSYANGVNKSHVYSFDITVAVKEWINSSTKRGCGLIFKAANETTVQSKTFASYERANYQPTFSMTYIDNTGAFTWIYLDNLIGEEYSGGMYTPNCFGYAMGVDNTIDIGQGFNPNTNYIYHFANDVEEYINNSVARRTVVKKFTGDWRSYKLEFNQYLVAIRVGNNSNYHFKVQINDGRWTEKNSYYPATEPSYYDPNLSVNWNSAYTSQTMFLVIEVG